MADVEKKVLNKPLDLPDGQIHPTIVMDPDQDDEQGVTFFSRYKDDVILQETSHDVQVGHNKWKTVPSVRINFMDRIHKTNKPDIIKFLREHEEYGRTILEFGVKEHEEKIKRYDDSGVMDHVDRLHRLGRIIMRQHRLGRG